MATETKAAETKKPSPLDDLPPELRKRAEVLLEPSTVVIIPEGSEGVIAVNWMRKYCRAPVEQQRVFNELHLPQLQSDLTVCALFRRPDEPAFDHVLDIQGNLRPRQKPDEELFAGMVVTEGIKTADYWHRPSPMSPGRADADKFLTALQPTLVPMRLDYVDKGEKRPQTLKLRTV